MTTLEGSKINQLLQEHPLGVVLSSSWPAKQYALFIDSWFMSCRVLKRGMGDFTLSTLVNYSNEKGFKNTIGEYLPTANNNRLSDHFPKLGFETIKGQNRYSLSCMLALTKTKNFISHANKQNGIYRNFS